MFSDAVTSEGIEELRGACINSVFDFVAHQGLAWAVLDVQHEPREQFEIFSASWTYEWMIGVIRCVQREFRSVCSGRGISQWQWNKDPPTQTVLIPTQSSLYTSPRSLNRFGYYHDRCQPFAPPQRLQAFSHQLWVGDALICYALYESSYTRGFMISIMIPMIRPIKLTFCKLDNVWNARWQGSQL